jgi:Tfp pilus assembly PilM family ATPase/Tfp pilus assembly protein PilN
VASQRVGKRKAAPRLGAVVVSLGEGRVRVLQAARRGADLVVQHWGAAVLAPDADSDTEARATLRALAEAGIKERRVILCLPAGAVALKRVQLPPAGPEQLPQLVAYEAQRHLPLPVEQLATGFHALSPAPDAGAAPAETEVLLAATRRGDLSKRERALAGVGLTVEGYGVDALAVTDAYLPVAEPTLNGHARLVLAPEGEGVHAQVLHGDQLLFNRFLSGGAGGWTTDLRRSLAAYSVEHPEAPVGDAVLLGAGSEDDLGRALGLEVRRAALSPAQMGGLDVPAEYNALVGLARQWLGLGKFPLRLDAQGWETAGATQGRSRMLLAGVAGVAAVGLLVYWQIDRQRAREADAAKAVIETRAAAKAKKDLDKISKERDHLRDQLAGMGGGASTLPLDLLSQVASRAPSDVWLTQVSYQTGKPLQLEGTARSAANATTFVRGLEQVPGFRRAELGYLRSALVNDVPVTHFRINCTLGSAPAPTVAAAPAATPTRPKEGM